MTLSPTFNHTPAADSSLSKVAKPRAIKLLTGEMPTVAEQLRAAREERKLSVYDVAEATKIKTDHVRALEEGNYDAFPAPVYIRGFVRTCAKLLKLDIGKLMADLDAELSETKRFREPPTLSGKTTGLLDRILLQISKVPWQWAVLLVGLALVLGIGWAAYRSWQHIQTRDPLKGLGPGIYSNSPAHSGEILPIPLPTSTVATNAPR
jgi:hypothetical protein